MYLFTNIFCFYKHTLPARQSWRPSYVRQVLCLDVCLPMKCWQISQQLICRRFLDRCWGCVWNNCWWGASLHVRSPDKPNRTGPLEVILYLSMVSMMHVEIISFAQKHFFLHCMRLNKSNCHLRENWDLYGPAFLFNRATQEEITEQDVSKVRDNLFIIFDMCCLCPGQCCGGFLYRWHRKHECWSFGRHHWHVHGCRLLIWPSQVSKPNPKSANGTPSWCWHIWNFCGMGSQPQVQDLRADVVPRDESVPVYAHPPRPILILTALWHPGTGKL